MAGQPCIFIYSTGAFISAMGSYLSCQHVKNQTFIFSSTILDLFRMVICATIEISIVLKAADLQIYWDYLKSFGLFLF